jgi:hypothetical protein
VKDKRRQAYFNYAPPFAGSKTSASAHSVSPHRGGTATASGAVGAGVTKVKEKAQPFGPFPKGRRGLVEKSSLIRHSPSKSRQEELQRMQSAERSSTNSENQAFLKDVSPGHIDFWPVIFFVKRFAL